MRLLSNRVISSNESFSFSSVPTIVRPLVAPRSTAKKYCLLSMVECIFHLLAKIAIFSSISTQLFDFTSKRFATGMPKMWEVYQFNFKLKKLKKLELSNKKIGCLTTTDFQKTNYLKTNLLKQIKKISSNKIIPIWFAKLYDNSHSSKY